MSNSATQGFDLLAFVQRRSIEILVSVMVLVTAFLFWDRMDLATGGNPTPPLDDTYIYLQYAKTFAMGDFYAWLPDGGYTTGATSMLYVPILAFFERIGFEGHALFHVAFVLGMVFWTLSLLILGRILDETFGRIPALMGLIAGSGCGLALWNVYSGMDSALLLCMTLWTFQECRACQQAKTPRPKVLILLGLLTLTRPEGVVFALILSLWLALSFKEHKWMKRWGPLVLVLGLALIMMWLHWFLTGSARTNGMATKSWLTDPKLTFFESLSHMFIELGTFLKTVLWPSGPGWHRAILLCLFFPAMIGCILRRRHIWILGLLIIVGIGLSFQSSYANVHRNRYQSAYLPIALAMGGAWLTAYGATQKEAIKRSIIGFFLVFLLWSGHQDVDNWGWRYALDARDIQRHPVAMGEWIRKNLKDDSVVAVHDAGAMPYFSEHSRFIDLVGLGTNGMGEWYRSGPGSLFEKIESLAPEDRPDYYIIYPDWFENADIHHAKPLYSIPLKRWSIVPHPEKMVFEARRDLFGTGERLWQAEHQGLHILAAADLADLDSEQLYAFHDGGRPGPTSYLRGHRFDGSLAGDGARWLRKESTLEFELREGTAHGLILRAAAPKGGRISIRVDSQKEKVLSLPAQPGFLEHKIDLLLPRTKGSIHVTIDPGETSDLQVGHVFLVSTIQAKGLDP